MGRTGAVCGVRCVFLNVGAGPLTQPLSKFFVRRALLAADYVSLRDNKSQALVQKIGFTGESRVWPDSAYGLKVAAVRGRARETGSQSIVGLASMDYSDPDPGGYQAQRDQIVYDAFIRKLASFASWLISRSHALARFLALTSGLTPRRFKIFRAPF
jgi:polysaccharide pyruvyl transferase WcaK-like protein